jgi:hypothetical protein
VAATTLFDRLAAPAVAKDSTPPHLANVVIKPPPEYPQSKRFRDWLVGKWPRATITLREAHLFGPRPRDVRTVQAQLQVLTEQRWVAPIAVRRRNRREWEILRRPTPR